MHFKIFVVVNTTYKNYKCQIRVTPYNSQFFEFLKNVDKIGINKLSRLSIQN